MRLLIMTPNWLGDIVMALPAIAAIRHHFASAHVTVATRTPFAPLLATVPGMDAIVGLPGVRIAEDAAIVADGRFDVAVLLPNSFRSAWIARRARVRERWGYRTDLRGWLLTRGVRRRRRRRGERRHHVLDYSDLIRGLAIEPVPGEPRVRVPDAARVRAAALLERYHAASGGVRIGIAPGAAYGHAKRWPPDRFADLIIRCQRAWEATCVLVGSAGDRDAGRAIESRLAVCAGHAAGDDRRSVRVVNLIGATDMETLLGVMALCRTFVSNDSGAMHLAAAVGLPLTAIFGPTDEHATAPLGRHALVRHPVWCRPCMLRDCPIDHRCMTGISTDRVFEAVSRQVGDVGPGAPSR